MSWDEERVHSSVRNVRNESSGDVAEVGSSDDDGSDGGGDDVDPAVAEMGTVGSGRYSSSSTTESTR